MQQEKTVTATYKDTSQPILTIRGKPVNPWLVLISLVFGFFMSLLDITIVNIAIPSIQTSLNTNLTTVTWVLNAYSLVFAILLVTMGRFADQYGRKRLFMIGMIIFSLGSLLCALSPTMASLTGWPAINWLIGFRAFQAIGAAALNPVSLAIIIAVFPRERRGAAIGVWGALSGLAAAAGPVLGGFLVQNFDWRWIFFVNLPFCIVGLIMVAMFVPETRELGTSKKLDPLGLLTLSIAIFCLVLAIIQGNDWGWTSTPVLSLFAGAIVAIILFFIVESRVSEPIVDFSLFKIRSFSASSVSIFLFGIAIQGAFLLLVLYFIDAQGYTQLDAAYAIIPIPLASFVVSALSGAFSQRISPRISGITGMALLAIGFFALATLNANSSWLDTTWRGIIIGAGMGLCFQSFPNMALSEIPRAKLGVGSGVFNTFRQIGFVLGVAILISLFVGQIKTNVQQATTNSIQIVQNNTSIPAQFHQPIIKGLQSAGSNANSSQIKPQSVDLTQFAQFAPPQFREQARASLKVLGDQIAAEFKNAVISAFTVTWIAAALFALLGLVGAFFTRMPGNKEASRAQDGEPLEVIEVPAAL
ncbi:MAG: MFS transporter [Ktedonobacteraceae bacterium]